MALKKTVEREGFSYIEDIDQLTPDHIEDAKSTFLDYQKQGVIVAGDYESDRWCLTNEVCKATISFVLDEFTLTKSCEKLGCTVQACRDSLRVYAISQLGFALRTVSNNVRAIICFLRQLTLSDDFASRSIIEDFLELLPGWSSEREIILGQIYNVPATPSLRYKRRELKRYQSYFKFDHYLTMYWKDAPDSEKILFFPIWLWWHLTAIIPLRVTEFTLIPRDCVYEQNGEYYIRLRRTKLKSNQGSAHYKIADDYEVCKYAIPANLYFAILSYKEDTDPAYHSDIDTLFSRPTQAMYTNTRFNIQHYTYRDLKRLLNLFYSQVLSTKYHLVIAREDADELSIEEIEKINLGDTRHIANISLMVSGNSALIVKELSRHDSINIGANYYGSVKSFLDALSFESFSPRPAITLSGNLGSQLKHYGEFEDVAGGRCISTQFKNGDYSVCCQVISPSGQIGDCNSCPYFLPNESRIGTMAKSAAQKLEDTCGLFVHTIEAIRRGDSHEPLPSVIERLQSDQLRYLTATAVERRYKEDVESYE